MKALLAPAAIALCTFLAACKPQPATETPAAPTAPAQPTAAAAPKVRLKTSQGDIVLELDRAKAPVTVENFLSYVGNKHYDGTVFHRVIDGFMIQGGGFAFDNGKLAEKPTGKGIKNEGTNGLKNLRGTIAMARTSDPDSATSQFFINVADNAALDYPSNGGYAVFGKVVEGMDVVDKIRVVPTAQAALVMINPANGARLEAPAGDVPTQAIVITSAAVEP
jgi:peptidyl-prolyl cis-trans isomerase A (cyclophilin A)